MATVTCIRCGNAAEGLDSPPMGGQLGERIQHNICSNCWTEWLEQQARVINHYGLQLADPDDRRQLMAYMKEYLNLEPAGA